jgi:hypothetical protein
MVKIILLKKYNYGENDDRYVGPKINQSKLK